MDEEAEKLAEALLRINLIALTVGVSVYFLTNIVFGLIAFGLSLFPSVVIYLYIEEGKKPGDVLA